MESDDTLNPYLCIHNSAIGSDSWSLRMTQTASKQTDVRHDPSRSGTTPWQALGLIAGIAIPLPAIMIVLVMIQPPRLVHAWRDQAIALNVQPQMISEGKIAYKNTCALCHGQDGQGVPRLGKPLRNSAYVQEHSDDELFALIAQGRLPSDEENTTGAVMPARGGQGIGDKRLANVVTYLRAIQDPSQPTVSTEAWVIRSTDPSTGADTTDLAGTPAGIGHELFVSSCAACHGTAGEGLEGLGKPLGSSSFVDSKSDDELIKFIKMGRPIWDAENTTGLDMPPKGGNPAISDEQLADIVSYLRSIHK